MHFGWRPVSFFFWPANPGANRRGMGLRQSLEIGLKRNPKITAGRMGVEGAQARIKQNLADYYPNLFLNPTIPGLKGVFQAAKAQGHPMRTIFMPIISDYPRIFMILDGASLSPGLPEDLKGYQWISRISFARHGYHTAGLLWNPFKRSFGEGTPGGFGADAAEFTAGPGFYQVGLKAKIDVTQAEVEVIKAKNPAQCPE